MSTKKPLTETAENDAQVATCRPSITRINTRRQMQNYSCSALPFEEFLMII
jgi:hypothetical protein